jgi:hypothetical protein
MAALVDAMDLSVRACPAPWRVGAGGALMVLSSTIDERAREAEAMCDHVWIFEARTLSTQPVRRFPDRGSSKFTFTLARARRYCPGSSRIVGMSG